MNDNMTINDYHKLSIYLHLAEFAINEARLNLTCKNISAKQSNSIIDKLATIDRKIRQIRPDCENLMLSDKNIDTGDYPSLDFARVFYGKNSFSDVHTMRELLEDSQISKLLSIINDEVKLRKG